MGKDLKAKLTHEEGQFLLKMAANVRAPKAIGKESLEGMMAFIDDWITHLRGVLKVYSPVLQKEKKLCFGLSTNWAIMESNPNVSRMVDPSLPIEVRLDEDALEGAFWCMRLAADPQSDFKASINDLDDAVWPLAKKLGYLDSLRSAIGLADVTKARRAPRTQDVMEKAE